MGKLNFPTTYRDDGLLGKLAEGRPLVTPPVQPGFPTTYREEGLVGKLPGLNFPTTYRDDGLVGKRAGSTSPPPIEMTDSWGSWPKDVRWLHPLYNRASPPPIEKRGSWGSWL